jgi:hypothetical protein
MTRPANLQPPISDPERERQIIETVVQQLAKAEPADDIIFDLCERYKLDWDEAEALIASIREDSENEIALRQSPIITLLALGTFIVGMGLYLYSISVIGEFLYIFSMIQGRVEDLKLTVFPYFLESPFNPVITLLTGLGMMLGGSLGMKPIWKALLSKIGLRT